MSMSGPIRFLATGTLSPHVHVVVPSFPHKNVVLSIYCGGVWCAKLLFLVHERHRHNDRRVPITTTSSPPPSVSQCHSCSHSCSLTLTHCCQQLVLSSSSPSFGFNRLKKCMVYGLLTRASRRGAHQLPT